MPTADAERHTAEARFAVGWQWLTREEFLEAITAALLDKAGMHLEQAEKSDSAPKASVT